MEHIRNKKSRLDGRKRESEKPIAATVLKAWITLEPQAGAETAVAD